MPYESPSAHSPIRPFAHAVCLLLLAACSRLEPLTTGPRDCRRTEVLDRAVLPERVEWKKGNDEAEQDVLDLWCETVGPAVLIPKPQAPDTGSAVADSIAIVSWNTHVGGGAIERFVRDLRAGRFTNGDSVRHIVMLLQEVYRASDSVPASVRIDVPAQIAESPPQGKREDIVATATRLGLSLLYVPSMRNGEQVREDRGNAILSTMPLDDPEAIDLPFERERRVVALATFKGETSGGRPWTFKAASMHLDNRSRNARITASMGVGRLRQSEALIEALQDVEPAVVTGDLNTWAIAILERAIPRLRAAFPDSPEPPPEITYVKGNVRRRIDYMFFRLPDDWRAHYQRIGNRYGSDHYPLLGWVVVGNPIIGTKAPE